MLGLKAPGARILLVGTETYTRGLTAVPAVGSTLSDLRKVLLERCGADPAAVTVVKDPANLPEMGDALANAAESATSVLLVYFVGHGIVNERGELHLAARDTDSLPSRLTHTALAYSAVRQLVHGSQARTRVVVLDCCYAGRALDGGLSGPLSVGTLGIDGTYVLAAASREDVAWAPVGAPHTAFTGAFIRFLWEGDPDAPEWLRLDDAYQYLVQRLPAAGHPRPERQNRDHAGKFVLAANPAYRPADARALAQGPDPDSAFDDSCPFPGPAAFTSAEAQWFRGRDGVVDDILRRLAARFSSGGPLAVVAPAGAGMSSLIHAGLVPALARGDLPVAGSRTWPHITLDGSVPHPVRALAEAVVGLSPGLDADETQAVLDVDPGAFAGILHTVLASRAGEKDHHGTRVVILVDRLAEAFVDDGDADERDRFLAALRAATTVSTGGREPPGLAVLALRADLFDRYAVRRELMSAMDDPFILPPMSSADLRAAIEEPAAKVGLSLEPGLVDLLLHDLDEHDLDEEAFTLGLLPVLARVLRATWERRSGRTMTVAGFREAGGIRQAVADMAEAAYSVLDHTERQVARYLLLGMVSVGAGRAASPRQADLPTLVTEAPVPAAARRVAGRLLRAHIIVADRDLTQLIHAQLLHWRPMQEWLGDTRRLLLRQQLIDAARTWEDRGRGRQDLYQGKDLTAALDWIDAEDHGDVTPRVREFVDAGSREQQHNERQKTRRLVTALLATVAFAIVLAIFAAYAVSQRSNANRQRDAAVGQRLVADSRQVAAEAGALRDTNPAVADLLSVQAFRIAETVEARSNLLSTQAHYYLAPTPVGHGALTAVVFSPGGNFHGMFATADQDGTVSLRDVDSRHTYLLSPPPGHGAAVYSAAFSGDGNTLAAAREDGTVTLWQWNASRRGNPVRTAMLSTGPDATNALVFTSGGRTLITGGNNGMIMFWDMARPAHPRLAAAVPGGHGVINALALSPDGSMLAAGDADTTTALWHLAGLRMIPAPIPLISSLPVRAVAFSPDGRTLATGDDDGSATLWSTATWRPRTLNVSTDAVRTLAFSPDSATLATGGDAVKLWNVSAGTLTASLSGPTYTVRGLAFMPGGAPYILAGVDTGGMVGLWTTATDHSNASGLAIDSVVSGPANSDIVATTGTDQNIKLWHRHSAQPFAVLKGAAGLATPSPTVGRTSSAIAISPDGRLLAATSQDGNVHFWDIPSGKPAQPHGDCPAQPATSGNRVQAIAFSPDGRILATAGTDKTIRLRTLATCHDLMVNGHLGAINAVAFSHDGKIIASASDDGTIHLNNVGTGSLIAPLTGHLSAVESVAFSPDGRTLASASADKTIRLWDVTDPALPRLIGQPLTGHTQPVVSIAFSPDGATIASAGEDNTIRLWDVKSRRPLATLTGAATTSLVAFAPASRNVGPDGQALVTADDAGGVSFWYTDPTPIIANICSELPALTADQQALYIPDGEQHQQMCPAGPR
jgi:WD40 repeat protein